MKTRAFCAHAPGCFWPALASCSPHPVTPTPPQPALMCGTTTWRRVASSSSISSVWPRSRSVVAIGVDSVRVRFFLLTTPPVRVISAGRSKAPVSRSSWPWMGRPTWNPGGADGRRPAQSRPSSHLRRVSAPRPGSSHIHQWPRPSRTTTSAPARSAAWRARPSPPV